VASRAQWTSLPLETCVAHVTVGGMVYGMESLRVADASIMPRITSANTMAPCVVIGGRAAQFINAAHRF
jgi:choline dehydrogenase-like flavoprotein